MSKTHREITVRIIDTMYRIGNEERHLRDLLKSAFPIGKRVLVYLREGQVNPSHGEVIHHQGGESGVLCVRLDSPKRHVVRVPVDHVRLP